MVGLSISCLCRLKSTFCYEALDRPWSGSSYRNAQHLNTPFTFHCSYIPHFVLCRCTRVRVCVCLHFCTENSYQECTRTQLRTCKCTCSHKHTHTDVYVRIYRNNRHILCMDTHGHIPTPMYVCIHTDAHRCTYILRNSLLVLLCAFSYVE